MIESQIAPYGSVEFEHCRAIRMEVFVREQGVPAEEEMDDLDATSTHVLALLDGEPVGTGRLILDSPVSARIGRMAVLVRFRGRGIGSMILVELMSKAAEIGVHEVSLAGQLHAIPFYERFGFVTHGDVFLDAGIQHRMMRRSLI